MESNKRADQGRSDYRGEPSTCSAGPFSLHHGWMQGDKPCTNVPCDVSALHSKVKFRNTLLQCVVALLFTESLCEITQIMSFAGHIDIIERLYRENLFASLLIT